MSWEITEKILMELFEEGLRGTTQELTEMVAARAEKCRDKVPGVLQKLYLEAKIDRFWDNSKKAFVWFMSNAEASDLGG